MWQENLTSRNSFVNIHRCYVSRVVVPQSGEAMLHGWTVALRVNTFPLKNQAAESDDTQLLRQLSLSIKL